MDTVELPQPPQENTVSKGNETLKEWWKSPLPGEAVLKSKSKLPKFVPDEEPTKPWDVITIRSRKTDEVLAVASFAHLNNPEEPLDLNSMKSAIAREMQRRGLDEEYFVREATVDEKDLSKNGKYAVVDTLEEQLTGGKSFFSYTSIEEDPDY